jgi:flagellar protein FlaG
MISGPLPISAKNVIGPDPGNVSGNRAGDAMRENGGKRDSPADNMDLTAITEDLNHKINMIHNVDLKFSVHEGSGQLLVKVIDAATGEVIREIPSSEVLNLAARLNEMIGLIFDQVG